VRKSVEIIYVSSGFMAAIRPYIFNGDSRLIDKTAVSSLAAIREGVE
jgi:hypothetical protein